MPPARFAGALGRGLGGAVLVGVALGAIVHERTPEDIPARPASGAVRVVTYNIRAGLGGLEEIGGELGRLHPDLVALQEVERGVARSRSRDQASYLADALGLEPAFAGSIALEHGEHGVAILSRWPISETELLPLPQGRGKWPRVALLARVEAPGGPVRFVSIHLARPWGWPLSNTGTRLEQIAALNRRLAQEELPVVVAGDFNSFPLSPEGWAVTRRLDHAWSPWRDGWATTFPVRVLGLEAGVKIDHVLHDERWSPRGTWVVPPGASDHRAVVADLELRSRE